MTTLEGTIQISKAGNRKKRNANEFNLELGLPIEIESYLRRLCDEEGGWGHFIDYESGIARLGKRRPGWENLHKTIGARRNAGLAFFGAKTRFRIGKPSKVLFRKIDDETYEVSLDKVYRSEPKLTSVRTLTPAVLP